MQKHEFLLLGGDCRQTQLARLLAEKHTVTTFHVPGLPDTAEEGGCENLILPCPAFSPQGLLRAEGEALPPDTPLRFAHGAERVFGGKLGPHRQALERVCGSVVDLLEDETVLLENAALTAEAALALTLTETQRALCGRSCLMLGWGRIAKRLSLLLRACGAELTLAARSAAARTEAATYGFRTTPPAGVRAEYELVFNTVPAQCLPETTLRSFSADCVWVELASKPGGIRQGLKLPLSVLDASALPGRILPRSAAELLFRGIVKHLG